MRASAAVCFYMFLGVGLVLLAIAQQPREIIIESPDARSVATDGVGAMDSSRSEEYSVRLTMFGSNVHEDAHRFLQPIRAPSLNCCESFGLGLS